MTRRKAAWIGITILFVVSLVGLIFGIRAFRDITLSETQIQERINQSLPVSKSGITVTRMDIDLVENSVAVLVRAEGEKWKQEFTISAFTYATPYYDNFEGAFYLQPDSIEIKDLTMKGERVSEKVERFVDRFVNSPKIVDNKEFIGEEIEFWIHNSIESAAVGLLTAKPVYTLPNTLKGNTFRMFLKSVDVGDGTITFHLSFLQFTKMMGFYAICLLGGIALTYGLLTNPGWGTAFLFLGGIGS